MVKHCEICGAEFETQPNGASRKYCFDCSPPHPKGGSRAKTVSTLRQSMKREAIRRKGGKCSRCGYDKSVRALEFHHRDASQKEFGLAANGNCHSWDAFWAEAQKCDLVCSNCHAEIHDELASMEC